MNKNTFKTVTTILGGSLFGLALVLGVTYSFSIPSAHALLGDGSTIDDGGGTGPGPSDPSPTPSVSMSATPSSIESGYSSQLSYSSSDVTSCSINNGVGAVPANASGARTVAPTSSTTYVITCESASGQVSAQSTVTVTAAPQPLSVYCSAGPDTAQVNETVQWSAFASTGSSGLTWKRGTSYYTKVCTGGQNYSSPNSTCEDVEGLACSPEGAKCRESAGCDGSTYTDPSGQPNAHTQYGAVTPFTCTAGSGSMNTFSWSGTDGLSGAVQNVSKAYASAGVKTGRVTVSQNTATTGGYGWRAIGAQSGPTCTDDVNSVTGGDDHRSQPTCSAAAAGTRYTKYYVEAATQENCPSAYGNNGYSVTGQEYVCEASSTTTTGSAIATCSATVTSPVVGCYQASPKATRCVDGLNNPGDTTCTDTMPSCPAGITAGGYYQVTGEPCLAGAMEPGGGVQHWPGHEFTAVDPSYCGTAPTATLTANPTSINGGSSSTLSWGSTNAASCSLNEGIGAVAIKGSRSVSPSSTTTYTLICSKPASSTNGTWQYFGDDYSDFSCPLTDMNKAYSSTPNCPSSPAGKTCTGNGMCKINTVAGNPACTIHTELYECRGASSAPSQNASATATVTVNTPAVTCSANTTSVLPGQSVTYTANPSGGAGAPYGWSSTSGSGFGTAVTTTRTFTNPGNYNMTVSASGVASAANCPLVSVAACPGGRTATIDADRTRVNVNGSVTLNWRAGGINTSCIVTGPTGTLYTSNATSCNVPDGSVTTSVAGQSTYTISCDSGAITDSVIVNVVPNFEEF